MARREGRQREGGRRTPDRFIDSPAWVTREDLRPNAIEALADKFSGRSFEDMLVDREFKRLSETELQALADEFRRRAGHIRAETGGTASKTKGGPRTSRSRERGKRSST
jgi:hypothetical protein